MRAVITISSQKEHLASLPAPPPAARGFGVGVGMEWGAGRAVPMAQASPWDPLAPLGWGEWAQLLVSSGPCPIALCHLTGYVALSRLGFNPSPLCVCHAGQEEEEEKG